MIIGKAIEDIKKYDSVTIEVTGKENIVRKSIVADSTPKSKEKGE